MTSNNPESNKCLDPTDDQSDTQILETKEISGHSSVSNQVITEYGKQNMFAYQVKPQLIENYTNYSEEAEKTNGRWAMIGMISLLVSYFSTGQIIPGIF